jgi:hypothetical protein
MEFSLEQFQDCEVDRLGSRKKWGHIVRPSGTGKEKEHEAESRRLLGSFGVELAPTIGR